MLTDELNKLIALPFFPKGMSVKYPTKSADLMKMISEVPNALKDLEEKTKSRNEKVRNKKRRKSFVNVFVPGCPRAQDQKEKEKGFFLQAKKMKQLSFLIDKSFPLNCSNNNQYQTSCFNFFFIADGFPCWLDDLLALGRSGVWSVCA